MFDIIFFFLLLHTFCVAIEMQNSIFTYRYTYHNNLSLLIPRETRNIRNLNEISQRTEIKSRIYMDDTRFLFSCINTSLVDLGISRSTRSKLLTRHALFVYNFRKKIGVSPRCCSSNNIITIHQFIFKTKL